MSDKLQRKVNREIRLFNKGLINDIAPYNSFRIKQEKRLGNDYESAWIISILKDDQVIATKLLDFYDIVSVRGAGYAAKGLYWYLNDTIIKNKL
jgi:hypothetical protein